MKNKTFNILCDPKYTYKCFQNYVQLQKWCYIKMNMKKLTGTVSTQENDWIVFKIKLQDLNLSFMVPFHGTLSLEKVTITFHKVYCCIALLSELHI